VTDLDPTIDPEITTAFEELVDWYTEDLDEPAGPPSCDPTARNRSVGAPADRWFPVAAGRAAWWVSAAAAVVTLLVLVVARTAPSVIEPAAKGDQAASATGTTSTGAASALTAVVIAVLLGVLGVATAIVRGSGRDGRRLVGMALWCGAVVTMAVLTWRTAVTDSHLLLLGRPGFGYSTLGIAVTVVLGGTAVAGGIVPRWGTWRGAALGLAGGAIVTLLFAMGNVALDARFAADEPALRAVAEAELRAGRPPLGSDPCQPPVTPNLPAFFGTVDEVCIHGGPAEQTILFRGRTGAVNAGGGPAMRGVAFDPRGDSFRPMSTCVRRLADHWWEYASLIVVDCPAGFTFIPGG
jgi:hypothetical protein